MIVVRDMADQEASKSRSDVAIVVIGRNEGDRLRRSLASVNRQAPTVYVDSGSVDDSVELAKAARVAVIGLPRGGRHSAARGRNAGLAWCDDPAIRYVQMVDGDCVLEPGWLDAAAAVLDGDAALVAAFGRLREVAPDHSVYNRLCDVEWTVTPGRARAFGGNVLLRRDAVITAGGYCEDMIAGEDIDLALRVRQRGGQIMCLPVDMARHDAAIGSFGAWWRRTARSGYAFSDLAARYPGPDGAPYRKSVARILWWGGIVPLVILAGAVAGVFAAPQAFWVATVALTLIVMQMLRMYVREARRHPLRTAAALSLFLTIGKFAEMAGLIRYWRRRFRQRPGRPADYERGSAP